MNLGRRGRGPHEVRHLCPSRQLWEPGGCTRDRCCGVTVPRAAGHSRGRLEAVPRLQGSSGLECLVFTSFPHRRHNVPCGGQKKGGESLWPGLASLGAGGGQLDGPVQLPRWFTLRGPGRYHGSPHLMVQEPEWGPDCHPDGATDPPGEPQEPGASQCMSVWQSTCSSLRAPGSLTHIRLTLHPPASSSCPPHPGSLLGTCPTSAGMGLQERQPQPLWRLSQLPLPAASLQAGTRQGLSPRPAAWTQAPMCSDCRQQVRPPGAQPQPSAQGSRSPTSPRHPPLPAPSRDSPPSHSHPWSPKARLHRPLSRAT